MRAELTQLRRVATTSGDREALFYGAGFALLALVVSMALPLRPKEH
jgi:hypothetical protein